MYQKLILTLFCTLFTLVGLSAQNALPEPTAFTFSKDKSALQQLMAFSESNPHIAELFFLEEQPKIKDGQIHIGTATGSNSFAYGNMTPAQLYAKILQVPTNQIYVDDDLKTQRYNLFYHAGGTEIDEAERQRIADHFLDRLEIQVSADSVRMDRMIIAANDALEESFAQKSEDETASVHSSPLQISIVNHPLSKVFTEVEKQPLFENYQLVDQTGLSKEQTLNLELNVETMDDFIATASEQGLEVRIESGTGQKVLLEPK